ncbi:MAG: PEP/pyruvate-binding domain-containing protein [Candidatus Fermentibacteria bacterium]|nr:PEP/pyruvate-binding domain-containing protein [Candidatus Fermentibacteria bacterium]
MSPLSDNGTVTTGKPEWKIILKLLSETDPELLSRLSRKMLNYLFRRKIVKISTIMEELLPKQIDMVETGDLYGENQPAPRMDYKILEEITTQVFRVAEEVLTPEEITLALHRWLRHEKIRFLSVTAGRRDVPLGILREALDKYEMLPKRSKKMEARDRENIIVGLTRRLLTEDLKYIGTIRKHVSIDNFAYVVNHTIGPYNGNGKVGGKAAGLFRAEMILNTYKKSHTVLRNLKVPKTWFISSDSVLEFISHNALEEMMAIKYARQNEIRQEYHLLAQIFKHSVMPYSVMLGLEHALDYFGTSPIIVRSSSLLEDSTGAAFAGKYKSLFVANQGSRQNRLDALVDAVLEIYASIFGPDPIEYRRERGLLDFNEEMGILIQEVVGSRIGKYHFPPFAGVAFSRNDYRWSPRIKSEDGIVRLVAGLGTRAVDRTGRDFPVLMSPGQPKLRINVTTEELIRYAQKYMDVVNLEKGCLETVSTEKMIKEHGAKIPCLPYLVSLYEEGAIQLSPGSMLNIQKKDSIVTFHNLLERSPVPLFFKTVLNILEDEIGLPVDIEFAYGRDIHTPYLLQCRPQSVGRGNVDTTIPTGIPNDDVVFTAKKYIMPGACHKIEYMVYVDGLEYDKVTSRERLLEIGHIVGKLNQILPQKKFILIGPGRWGSKGDIKLGVHVGYSDINNTAMLIEVAKKRKGQIPDLSFGTHFFQDLVEADIRYLPLYPDDDGVIFREEIFFNKKNYLTNFVQAAKGFEQVIKVIKIDDLMAGSSLSVILNGDTDEAIAFLAE